MKKIWHVICNNCYMVKTVFKNSPEYFILSLIPNVTYSLFNIYRVYFTKMLFDLYERQGAFNDFLKLVIPYFIASTIVTLLNLIFWFVFIPNSKQRMQYRLHDGLYAKARKLDLACYDNPEFFNSFVWAMNTADKQAVETVDSINNLVYNIISISGIMAIIATINSHYRCYYCLFCRYLLRFSIT